jgi:hypothetical protein
LNRSGLNRAGSRQKAVCIERLLSGGQTGVDRAALDVAMALNIPCGGWCPRGRRAEDGRIAQRYPLQEMATASYADRTVQNVIDSDGTLILALGRLSGGTLLTTNVAQRRGKPWLFADLRRPPDVAVVHDWLSENAIRVLNVAGPRRSQAPTIYGLVTSFLLKLLSPRAQALSSSHRTPDGPRQGNGEGSRQKRQSPRRTQRSKSTRS